MEAVPDNQFSRVKVYAMSFADKRDEVARLVEARLTELLAPSAVDRLYAGDLEAAVRYGVLDGGKRLRPFLLMECAALFGVDYAQSLDAACALECVHCYSLIHDDLPAMDDDAMRRGRPSVHIAYDEATAILAGDALLTLAFQILADDRTHPDSQIRAELVLLLAQAAGWRGMAGGQALDLASEGKQLDSERVSAIHALKTGALIRFACVAGATLAGAASRQRTVLEDYGAALGEAFQLADDLLDLEGNAERLGKAAQKDQAAGKATIVATLGSDGARAKLEALESQAVASLEPFGADAAALADAARFAARRAH